MKRKISTMVLLMFVLLLVSVVSMADQVAMKDGTKLYGKVLAYDGEKLVVQTGQGYVNSLPIPDVASFVISASEELSKKMDRLQQDMTYNIQMLDRLAVSWERGKENIRSEIYDLSPISKVFISERRASMKNDRLTIEGRLQNESAAFLRNILVRVYLLDVNGQVVYQQDVPLTTSVVASGESVRFRTNISNPPRFDSYDVQVVGGDAATLKQLEGQNKR